MRRNNLYEQHCGIGGLVNKGGCEECDVVTLVAQVFRYAKNRIHMSRRRMSCNHYSHVIYDTGQRPIFPRSTEGRVIYMSHAVLRLV